jgi:short-subunit dehydrogenase
MPAFRPIALVTGASSGIGAALARVFAAHGHEVAMVARNEPALAAVADEIGKAGHARPHVLAVDLARLDGSARLGQELAARALEPAFVVNNAGFGLAGSAAELERAEQLAMIDLNIRTLTDMSLRWTESLQRHRGGLMNVASVAGFLSGPGMAVYYASKAYVVSFTEALHAELANKGVRVTALCPGPVATAFHARAGLAPDSASGMLAQSADTVARQGYQGLMAGKRLVVPGLANKLVTFLPRFAPRGLILDLVHKRQKRQQKARSGPQWPRRGA